MKQKALKIDQKTLFVYKTVKSKNPQLFNNTTDPTTGTLTTLTTTTGFNR